MSDEPPLADFPIPSRRVSFVYEEFAGLTKLQVIILNKEDGASYLFAERGADSVDYHGTMNPMQAFDMLTLIMPSLAANFRKPKPHTPPPDKASP